MLSWVVTFLVVALIAGILGFGGIAGASVEIAKAIFFIAVILFLVWRWSGWRADVGNVSAGAADAQAATTAKAVAAEALHSVSV